LRRRPPCLRGSGAVSLPKTRELRLAGAGLWAAKLISTISLFSGPKRFLHRAENA
jgi:hypothetical protein